jgi:hypothetical protein
MITAVIVPAENASPTACGNDVWEMKSRYCIIPGMITRSVCLPTIFRRAGLRAKRPSKVQ